MSEVHAAFRQLGGDAFDSLSDEELTLFIGTYFPKFKNHPAFGQEYGVIKEARDERIIHDLQVDIAGEVAAQQQTTGKKVLERLKLGFGSGLANVAKSFGGALQGANQMNLSPAMQIPAFRKGVESITEFGREQEQEFAEAGEMVGGGLGSEFAQALAAGSASIVPSVVGAYFGGIPGAMATGGIMQFGDTYDEAVQTYIAEGMPVERAREEALKPALISGTITAGMTSFGGAERFFSRLGRGLVGKQTAKTFLKEILKSSGLEGVEEGADQFAQGFVERSFIDPTKSFSEQLRESAMAAAVGLTLGGVLPGGALVVRRSRRAVVDAFTKNETAPETTPIEPVPESPSKGKPFQEGPIVDVESTVRQATAGELLSGQWDMDILGRAVPMDNITINEDGTVSFDLNGQPVNVKADEILRVRTKRLGQPAPPPIEEASAEPTGEQPQTQTGKPTSEADIPDAALRAFPASVQAVADFVAKILPRKPGDPPPVQLDTDIPFPDFQVYDQARKIWTQPFAAGKVPILGWVMDPNARHLTNIGEGVNTFWAEAHIGNSIAGAYKLQIQSKFDPLFPVDNKGFVTTVKPRAEGQSMALGDIIESLMADPKSYEITPEQLAAVEELKAHGEMLAGLLKKYAIKPFEVAEGDREVTAAEGPFHYLPRPVIKRPGKPKKPQGGGSGITGKASFQKARVFKTEAEGIAAEYKYEPSLEHRMVMQVERVYRKIAERRFMDSLEKEPRQTKVAELREVLEPLVKAGKLTEQGLETTIENRLAEMTPRNPVFRGYVYPAESVEELNKAFPNTSTFYSHFVTKPNNLLKMLQLGYDIGVMANQGVMAFYMDPKAWAIGTGRSLQAMLDPDTLAAYAATRQGHIREMVQMGSSMTRLEEYMAGAERGEFLERAPLVGPVTRMFARQFQTFLTVAKIEMYAANRDLVQPYQLPELVRSLETVLSTGRMEAIGLGTWQSRLERIALRAPSYYRGGINLVAMVGQGGVSGKIARKAFGRYLFGGTALFAALGLAIGMTWDEILERLNPDNSEFMNWRVQTSEGNAINFGFGGFHRGLIRALTESVAAMYNGEWDRFAKGTSEDNPLVRWYRAKASPSISLTWDFFSGKDYLGEETNLGILFSDSIPLASQELQDKEFERKRSPAEKALAFGISTLGVSSHPESFGRARMHELNKLANEHIGKDYDRLTVQERQRMLQEFENTAVFTERPDMAPSTVEFIKKMEDKNSAKMKKDLTKEARNILEENDLKFPTLQTRFTVGGQNIVMTTEERERYMELISEETSNLMEKNSDRFTSLEDGKKKELFSDLVKKAKAKALSRLKRELPEEQ